jgi:hypothetical protein
MAEIYKMFASEWENVLDFSDEQTNGYMHGKKWLNLNVTMWKEDIEKGLLFVHELYEDPKFPHWWLDRIFK